MLVCAMWAMTVGAVAQNNITVQDAIGQSPEAFVQNHLLGGGVYIFNARYNNASSNIATASIGTFQSNGFTGLSMQGGVLMTTGNIAAAVGPNTVGDMAVPIDGYYVDPEMGTVATNVVHGCSTLDFDFVSLSGSVSFNYTFASEEYPEYVCSDYNDVFAFFVTGPDPVTGQEVTRNIAVIPGTVTAANPEGIAVAINSVNPGVPGSSTPATGVGCHYEFSGFYSDNGADATVATEGMQYDGYTNKLAAQATVLPCQVYHMHISVCNVGDNDYDSGVFLEGGSFVAPTAAIGLSRPGTDTLKGTCPLAVPLTLAQTSFDEGRVHFSFGGTAVEGVDFELVDGDGAAIGPQGFAIDNGTRTFVLRGLPTADREADKSVEVYLATSLCPAFPQLLTYDTMHFVLTRGGDVRVKDTTIRCSFACFEVGTELVYGEDPVSYRWVPTTGIDDPYSLHSTAMIFESTDYQLIATGGSGCGSDTADVHVVITGEAPVGVDDVDIEGIRIYPNPASELLYIEAADVERIELYSVDGRCVYDHAVQGATGVVSIPTDALPDGVYAVRVSTRRGVQGARIVVNKKQ